MANTVTSTLSPNLLEIKRDNENNKSILIKQADHFAPLKNLTSYEHLKDVIIEVGEQEFRAHKVILANSIGFFDELYRSTTSGEIDFDIHDPEIMNAFITYAYTGEIEVTEDNVFSILKAATILKTDNIHKSCRVFLTTLMLENFESASKKKDYLDLDFEFWKVVILSVKLQVSTQSIFNTVMRWINHDYDQRNTHTANLLSLVEWCDLTSDYIDSYLFQEENSIGFKHKEIVFEVHSRRYQVVKQINSTNRDNNVEASTQSGNSTNNENAEHLENRGENLENDVGYQSSGESSRDKVPRNTMTKIPQEVVHSLQKNKLISNIVKEELLLSDDMNIENSLDENSSENEADDSSTREQTEDDTRNCSIRGISLIKEEAEEASNKKIFVLSLDQYGVIETYDPETNVWTTIQMAENGTRNYIPDEKQRNENMLSWFSCTGYNGKLYKFGGMKATKKSEFHFPNVEVFKPGKNTWKVLEPMTLARRESGAASLKKSFYVCGGWTGKEITNAVERYSSRHKKWELISPMKERRCAPAVIAFDNHIYAIGGAGPRVNSKQDFLDTIEVYDLETKTWSILDAKMKTKRSSCGAAVLNGKIYVCGGWNDTIALNVVEMFDPKLKTWTTVESMNKGRKQFLVVAFSGKLWAIGGARSETWVEVYDPKENRWSCKERKGVNTNFYVTGSVL